MLTVVNICSRKPDQTGSIQCIDRLGTWRNDALEDRERTVIQRCLPCPDKSDECFRRAGFDGVFRIIIGGEAGRNKKVETAAVTEIREAVTASAHGCRPFVIVACFGSQMHQIIGHCIPVRAGGTVPEEGDADRDRNTDDDDAEYDEE